jgi:hypothetical protein
MVFAMRRFEIEQLDGESGVHLRDRASRHHPSSASVRFRHLQAMGSAEFFDRIQVGLRRPMGLLELLPRRQLSGPYGNPLEVIEVPQRGPVGATPDNDLDRDDFIGVGRRQAFCLGERRVFTARKNLVAAWRRHLRTSLVMILNPIVARQR